MKKVWAVFKRELGVYFRSPIAYAIAFALLLFMGLVFNANIVQGNQQVTADTLVPFIPSLFTFLLFLIGPLLTMRLLAEEAREGTLELLMTLPLKEWHFIVGKFLAVWAYYTGLLALTLIYQAILARIGVPDTGTAVGAYLGAWLYGGAVLALTMIWSAVTEDQVVAAFLGAATVLMLFLSDLAAIFVSNLALIPDSNRGFVTDLLREMGLQAHYNVTMAQGIIRAEDVLYFVFMTVGALFITARIVEVRRWRA